jgi:adenine-specific DNA-methyltransferase
MKPFNVESLGQVFTTLERVEEMLSLRQNKGSILEPSCGDGAFWKMIKDEPKALGIEIDPSIAPKEVQTEDFFKFKFNHMFHTIIGNPPYVKFKNILPDTTQNLDTRNYDKRTNLYIFFIDRCLDLLEDNGEIIFITPREFINATSAIYLNNKFFKLGTVTHFYDLGDKRVFKGFSPNCAIWRFQKNCFTRQTITNNGVRHMSLHDGQLFFTNKSFDKKFSDFFMVKVGAVSGCDSVFCSKNGDTDFVGSFTRKNGQLKRYYYKNSKEMLVPFKNKLLERKIKEFDENNWWQWGREHHKTNLERIYVNCKTRIKNPFFTNECKDYDGSVLAIFPKKESTDLGKTTEELNKINWREFGFMIGDRYVFSQRSLENMPLPKGFFEKIKN